jgi:hypothetical protein
MDSFITRRLNPYFDFSADRPDNYLLKKITDRLSNFSEKISNWINSMIWKTASNPLNAAEEDELKSHTVKKELENSVSVLSHFGAAISYLKAANQVEKEHTISEQALLSIESAITVAKSELETKKSLEKIAEEHLTKIISFPDARSATEKAERTQKIENARRKCYNAQIEVSKAQQKLDQAMDAKTKLKLTIEDLRNSAKKYLDGAESDEEEVRERLARETEEARKEALSPLSSQSLDGKSRSNSRAASDSAEKPKRKPSFLEELYSVPAQKKRPHSAPPQKEIKGETAYIDFQNTMQELKNQNELKDTILGRLTVLKEKTDKTDSENEEFKHLKNRLLPNINKLIQKLENDLISANLLYDPSHKNRLKTKNTLLKPHSGPQALAGGDIANAPAPVETKPAKKTKEKSNIPQSILRWR